MNHSQPHLQQEIAKQLQLVTKVGAPLKKWKKLADRSKDRYNRLKELVTTEWDYYNDLSTIKVKIKEQLLRENIITGLQANTMFPNIEGMIDLSGQIHDELKAILQNWNRSTTILGTPMIKFSRFLMIYSDFFKNLVDTQSKLRDILAKNEKARQIEKNLSTANKIVTIENLISKPFQRPLKYHLILRDYWSKTDPNHPDYTHLKTAIECYHKVNEQNNMSVQNKEKDQTLVSLNFKYGNIIQSEARYYIGQYDAVCLQTHVIIYLLSDLVLLVIKKTPEREFLRISYDKFSHVQPAGDLELFKNRLFFYGKKICVHLTFADKMIRDDFYHTLKKLIIEINVNQCQRETAINDRVSRRSTNLKRKFSYTNLQPQLLRPINVKVLGIECRQMRPEQLTYYYVISFSPTLANFNNSYSPYHISLLQQQTINKLQKLIDHLYPQQLKCMPIFKVPRSIINEFQYRKNERKRIEITTLFIQLFLNSIFRCQQIVKRIDYIMYTLQISDPLWNYLKINNQLCMCKACLSRQEFKNYSDYYKEVLDREYKKTYFHNKNNRTQYCELRTIHSHKEFSDIYPEMLFKAKSEEKIAWCKSKLGRINHSLTNSKPDSQFTKTVKITVVIRGFPNVQEYPISCNPNDRVKKIISIIGHRREMDLSDYALVAQINRKAFVLDDDEPISNVFRRNEEEGFLNRISSFFSKKEEVAINFSLQKYWVVCCANDYFGSPQKGRRMKVNSEVESIMGRLYASEMRVGEEDLLEFYALFLAKKYYNQYKTFNVQNVAMKVRNRAEIYFPSKLHQESIINRLYQKIKKIANDLTIKSDFDLAIKIITKASQRPGWSCIMFDCLLKTGISQPMRVRVGCDLRGVRVRQSGKVTMLLEFRLEEDTWSYYINGTNFIIADGHKQFNFEGKQIWKVGQQIQFYKLYLKSFGSN